MLVPHTSWLGNEFGPLCAGFSRGKGTVPVDYTLVYDGTFFLVGKLIRMSDVSFNNFHAATKRGGIPMKLAYRLLLVVVLLTAFAAPSFASSCPTLIKAANDKMATMDAMSDKVQQAKLLVGEADKAHKAGNHAESVQKANEALSLLN